MEKKIKLYLLTGFLGSGKTTLLTKIIDHLSNKKVGVIMNEFGKVGIDGTIIKKEGMELVEINRGSIFCSCLKLSFANAMVEMADRNMDYLFVESSGLADPSNIAEILRGVTAVRGDIYEYAGAICLIDGLNFLDQIDEMETVERQLKHCNLAVINKIDLIDESALANIKEKIKVINNKVEIVTSAYGTFDYRFLEQDIIINGWVEEEETTNTPESKPKTLSLTFNGEIQKEKLTRFLDEISNDCFRIKGFFKLEDGWNQVDVVNGKIDYRLSNTKENTSQLVFISKIGPKVIRPIFNAWEEIIGEEMKLNN